MDAAAQEDFRLRLLALRTEIQDLEVMSAEAGDYGYCNLCDEDISVGRLGIDPTYSLCIRCAEKSI